tara:strand:- start:13406 stop:13729 length:324 start_codon:yes stop_codon:yes gene_type:complete
VVLNLVNLQNLHVLRESGALTGGRPLHMPPVSAYCRGFEGPAIEEAYEATKILATYGRAILPDVAGRGIGVMMPASWQARISRPRSTPCPRAMQLAPLQCFLGHRCQ